MLEICVGYQVDDKEGRSFRPLNDIARDVEKEMFFNSALFSEADYYKIIVSSNSEHSVIECFKNKEERELLMKGEIDNAENNLRTD